MSTKNCMVFAIYSRKSKFTGKGESIENQILREIVRNIIEKMNNSPLYKTNLNGWSDNAHSDYGWSEHSDFYSDRY